MTSLSKRENNNSELVVPLKPVSLREIEAAVGRYIEGQLGRHPALDLFVYMKQMAAIADIALEKLEPKVLESLKKRLPSGNGDISVLGHQVRVRTMGNWSYSQDLFRLNEAHKSEVRKLRNDERRLGKATRIQRNEPRIQVRLKRF